jgi:hypothetical protein
MFFSNSLISFFVSSINFFSSIFDLIGIAKASNTPAIVA